MHVETGSAGNGIVSNLDRSLGSARIPLVGDTRERSNLGQLGRSFYKRHQDVQHVQHVQVVSATIGSWLERLLDLPAAVQGPATRGAVDSSSASQSERRPSVLLIAHDIHDGGGMERANAELVRALHDEYRFTVVSSSLAEDLRPLVQWRRVRVPSEPFLLKYLAFMFSAGLIRKGPFDLVHVLGAIIPGRADVASVHFCHAGHQATNGSSPVGISVLRRINNAIVAATALLAERWCYQPARVRVLAAVSHGVRCEIERHYPDLPVVVTANGVDRDRFHPDASTRTRLRAEVGIEEWVCIALFVGGDWDRKGLSLALEALAQARTEGTDLGLWVVGAGDEGRFGALAHDLGIADDVRFFGRRTDTERFYCAADLFLLPSSYETFSLVCFEAAACGLPLVIPPISGAGELVGDDEAGLIVARDGSSIARALIALARNPIRRAELGAEARRRSAPFTWEASAAAVAEVYHSLLAERETS